MGSPDEVTNLMPEITIKISDAAPTKLVRIIIMRLASAPKSEKAPAGLKNVLKLIVPNGFIGS